MFWICTHWWYKTLIENFFSSIVWFYKSFPFVRYATRPILSKNKIFLNFGVTNFAKINTIIFSGKKMKKVVWCFKKKIKLSFRRLVIIFQTIPNKGLLYIKKKLSKIPFFNPPPPYGIYRKMDISDGNVNIFHFRFVIIIQMNPL